MICSNACLETISVNNKHLYTKGVQKVHYDYYQIKPISLSSSKLTSEAAGHVVDNISSSNKVEKLKVSDNSLETERYDII